MSGACDDVDLPAESLEGGPRSANRHLCHLMNDMMPFHQSGIASTATLPRAPDDQNLLARPVVFGGGCRVLPLPSRAGRK